MTRSALSILHAFLCAAALCVGAGAASAEDNPGRAITASGDYVRLDPVMTSIPALRSPRALLHVELGLHTSDPALRARISEREPYLRDAFVSAMAVYAGASYRPGQIPDVERIAELLQRAADRALGEDGAVIALGMVMIHDQ